MKKTLPGKKEKPTKTLVLIFRRMDHPTRLGLVEWVRHLFESDAMDAEVIHPMGLQGGNSIADRIGTAAYQAALKILIPGQIE